MKAEVTHITAQAAGTIVKQTVEALTRLQGRDPIAARLAEAALLSILGQRLGPPMIELIGEAMDPPDPPEGERRAA